MGINYESYNRGEYDDYLRVFNAARDINNDYGVMTIDQLKLSPEQKRKAFFAYQISDTFRDLISLPFTLLSAFGLAADDPATANERAIENTSNFVRINDTRLSAKELFDIYEQRDPEAYYSAKDAVQESRRMANAYWKISIIPGELFGVSEGTMSADIESRLTGAIPSTSAEYQYSSPWGDILWAPKKTYDGTLTPWQAMTGDQLIAYSQITDPDEPSTQAAMYRQLYLEDLKSNRKSLWRERQYKAYEGVGDTLQAANNSWYDFLGSIDERKALLNETFDNEIVEPLNDAFDAVLDFYGDTRGFVETYIEYFKAASEIADKYAEDPSTPAFSRYGSKGNVAKNQEEEEDKEKKWLSKYGGKGNVTKNQEAKNEQAKADKMAEQGTVINNNADVRKHYQQQNISSAPTKNNQSPTLPIPPQYAEILRQREAAKAKAQPAPSHYSPQSFRQAENPSSKKVSVSVRPKTSWTYIDYLTTQVDKKIARSL